MLISDTLIEHETLTKEQIDELVTSGKYITNEEEKENQIQELKEENFSLRSNLQYFKRKFTKLIKFLQEKLFGWGKKEPMYKKVVEDLYDKGILDDDDKKCIEKDDYEL